MNKKYIVRLSKKEREELLGVVKRLKGSSQKVRRAQVLLKADVRERYIADRLDASSILGVFPGIPDAEAYHDAA